jgi:hypothetical protein
MPKYQALFLLYSRADEKYIQPGEVLEISEPEKERILLEMGLVKPASAVKAQVGEEAAPIEAAPKIKK